MPVYPLCRTTPLPYRWRHMQGVPHDVTSHFACEIRVAREHGATRWESTRETRKNTHARPLDMRRLGREYLTRTVFGLSFRIGSEHAGSRRIFLGGGDVKQTPCSVIRR